MRTRSCCNTRFPFPLKVPASDYGILAGDFLVAVNDIDLVKRLATVPGARAKCDEVRRLVVASSRPMTMTFMSKESANEESNGL